MNTLIGTNANDRLVLKNETTALIFGRDGRDTIRYVSLSGKAEIDGGLGQDRILGGLGMDFLLGGSGEDVIFGDYSVSSGGSHDRLFGGDGNDFLSGEEGRDHLWGGSGDDTFFFRDLGHQNRDAIFDFASGDTIKLSAGVFTGLDVGTLPSSEFHIGKFPADVDDHIIYNQSSGALFYDPDGKGGVNKIQLALVDNQIALSAADFIVSA